MAHHHDICIKCFQNVNGCACEEQPSLSELDELLQRKQKIQEEMDKINKRISELRLQAELR